MSVFMPHWPKPLGKRPINFGLDRVLKVLKNLGNPHKSVPPVVHVAGTNGKGSTIAFLNSILKSAGYSSHVYTSPHLIDFNERIKISGQEIKDKYLQQTLEDVRHAAKSEKLTFFEGTTLAAILAFSKNKADFCLIETGMGGRLDATNVFEDPVLSIITAIDYDHTSYLGKTIEKIAYEKSGIIKHGTTCIISDQMEAARLTLEESAIKKRAPVFRCNFEWQTKPKKNGFLFCHKDQEEFFKNPSLLGQHQIKNAGNAIAASTILANKFGYKNIDFKSIESGILNAKWPARLQPIIDKKNKLVKILSNGWQLFLDGAHNTCGARVVANWLGNKKAHFIVGMTREKDTKGFLNAILPNIESLSAVCVKSEPRSQTTKEIAESAKLLSIKCNQHEYLEQAVQEALNQNSQVKIIIICGSLFLARDIFSYLVG